MKSYLVTFSLASSKAMFDVDASNTEEAYTKALEALHNSALKRYLPSNPRAYAKIVPKVGIELSFSIQQ